MGDWLVNLESKIKSSHIMCLHAWTQISIRAFWIDKLLILYKCLLCYESTAHLRLLDPYTVWGTGTGTGTVHQWPIAPAIPITTNACRHQQISIVLTNLPLPRDSSILHLAYWFLLLTRSTNNHCSLIC